MPRRCADRTGDAGFTLIEVLVALVIVGLTLAALASVFGSGLLGQRAAGAAETALALAQEKLAAAGVAKPLRRGESDGVFAGRYAWRVAVAKYRDKAENKEGFDAPRLPNLRLYRVAVTVTWRQGRRAKTLRLATLRLGPRSEDLPAP